MQVIAFILAVIAGALFLADYLRSKSFIALGLAVLDAAWIVELVFQTGSTVKVT